MVYTLFAIILALLWIITVDIEDKVVFFLLFVFFSDTFVKFGPAVGSILTPNLRLFDERLGMLFISATIGVLIKNPITGTILDHKWKELQLLCDIMITLSVIHIIVTRISKVGFKLVV